MYNTAAAVGIMALLAAVPALAATTYSLLGDAVIVAGGNLGNAAQIRSDAAIAPSFGGVIVAREEIPPFRKDVLAKMSGGDRTRKDKLLEAQKKGKSKLINVSKVQISQKALLNLVSEEF